MPASTLHSQALTGDAGVFPLPDSESRQSQEGREPIHNLCPSPYALSKHLVSIHFVQEPGVVTKTNQNTRFTKAILVAFRWPIHCFPWVQPLNTTPVPFIEVSPGHRLQHPSGQTCAVFFVVALYEKAN